MMNWQIQTFEEIDKWDLFKMLELRTNIFVVEQICPYPELDEYDLKCTHVLLKLNDQVIGTARIFPVNHYKTKIGRVCIEKSYRGKGLAHELMTKCIEYCKSNQVQVIQISAQSHLESFYKSHGFKTVSEMYLEDGIPHIKMQLTL